MSKSRTFTAIAGLAITAAAAAPAEAAVKRVTVRQGPFVLGPYEVRSTSASTRNVRAPRLDGYLVRMRSRVVDSHGRPMPVRRAMLHHVVYKTRARRDPVCGDTESFYGTGEENQALRLPAGYGYPLRRRDRWITGWMLMNHTAQSQPAYIEYTAWVETSRRLRAVTPYWVRVTGCSGRRDPIFNVPGGGAPGSTFSKSAAWTVPESGRLVAGGSHVHGGARDLSLAQPRCGNRALMVSKPLYGLPGHPYYNVLPVLHEPGPIATSWITSAAGIPVRRGERLRVTSRYDASRPHTRVMGIWHLYLARERRAARRCRPLPRDTRIALPPLRGRREPPAVTVPLTGRGRTGQAVPIARPPGPVVQGGLVTDVAVNDGGYSVRNLVIPLGGTVRWHFESRLKHDVTLADGPVGFASRWSVRGDTYHRRFDTPGRYRIFCSLHPLDMSQVIDAGVGG